MLQRRSQAKRKERDSRPKLPARAPVVKAPKPPAEQATSDE
jgi:hypothetical protein